MKLRQYKLVTDDKFGMRQTDVCWLEDGRVKVGDRVTLKDSDYPEKLWTIERVYSSQESADLKRGWDNNI